MFLYIINLTEVIMPKVGSRHYMYFCNRSSSLYNFLNNRFCDKKIKAKIIQAESNSPLLRFLPMLMKLIKAILIFIAITGFFFKIN